MSCIEIRSGVSEHDEYVLLKSVQNVSIKRSNEDPSNNNVRISTNLKELSFTLDSGATVDLIELLNGKSKAETVLKVTGGITETYN